MRWLKEPLFHFLLIGTGLFILFYQVGDSTVDRPDRILVTAADIDRMATLWSRRWQRPPTPGELEGLIESHIREEVLYREAHALGLERDDTIVRRRMAQKMEFLFEDLTPLAEPTEAELQAFLQDNAERFQESPRFSFLHVYLNADQRGEQSFDDARLLLDDLRIKGSDADIVTASDPFPMLEHRLEDRSERDIARLLGQNFAEGLTGLPIKQWCGPIESAYGVHLVYVLERTELRMPILVEVRDRVSVELLIKKQREANKAMYRTLRDRYEIVVEKPVHGELGY